MWNTLHVKDWRDFFPRSCISNFVLMLHGEVQPNLLCPCSLWTRFVRIFLHLRDESNVLSWGAGGKMRKISPDYKCFQLSIRRNSIFCPTSFLFFPIPQRFWLWCEATDCLGNLLKSEKMFSAKICSFFSKSRRKKRWKRLPGRFNPIIISTSKFFHSLLSHRVLISTATTTRMNNWTQFGRSAYFSAWFTIPLHGKSDFVLLIKSPW